MGIYDGLWLFIVIYPRVNIHKTGNLWFPLENDLQGGAPAVKVGEPSGNYRMGPKKDSVQWLNSMVYGRYKYGIHGVKPNQQT